MKGKEIVKGIRDESVKRPQRVVIDEELPDNRFRILVANMKSTAKEPDLMSRGTWDKETEQRRGAALRLPLRRNGALRQLAEDRG